MYKKVPLDSPLPEICPVTGKRIITKERWYYRGKHYSIRVGILDGKILIQSAAGYPTREDLEEYFRIYDEVTSQYEGVNGRFITIDDYTHIYGTSVKTRQYLIEKIKASTNLVGKIFYNVSIGVRSSINLGKRLHILPFRIEIGKNYADALSLANEILNRGWAEDFHSKSNTNIKLCPYSGLKLIEDEEFTAVDMGGYSISIKMIGDRILYYSMAGDIQDYDIVKDREYRDRFIEKYVPKGHNIIEILDITKAKGLPSRKDRNEIQRETRKIEERVLEVIICNKSLLYRLVLGLFNKSRLKTYFRNSLKSSILLAQKHLQKNIKIKTQILFEKVLISKPDWIVESPNFSYEWKIMPGKIIAVTAEGTPTLDDVEQILKKEKAIAEEYFSGGQHFYRIADLSQIRKVENKVKFAFAKGLKKLYAHKKYANAIVYVVGVNRFVTIGTKMLKYFWVNEYHFEKSIVQAYEKIKKNEARLEKIKTDKILYSKQKAKRKKFYKESEIKKEIDRVIEAVVSLSRRDQNEQIEETTGHLDLFAPIFESLNVATSDIDAILEEKALKEKTIKRAESDIMKTREEVLAKAHARGMSYEANRAKSSFLASISHELRNPMHGIISYARFGEKKLGHAPKDKIKQYFRAILETGNDLLVLLDELLDVSKMESGDIVINFQMHDLDEIVKNIIKRFHAKCMEKKVSIQYIKPDIDLTLSLDNAKIRQVMSNILSNAIKYTPEGSVIRIVIEEEDGALVLAVYDGGVGIPEGELESIFEEFAQSSNTDRAEEGTGLGLAISKKIMIAHNGDIWAENNPDGGAIFKIKLLNKKADEKRVA